MSHRENKERRTLYCGNLHENVTEEILFELFLQSGPLESITLKRDGRRPFAFITFKHEESVPYAEAILENVYLFNRPLRLSARSANKDFNNNPNEPYTPEIYGNDSLLHRQPPWNSPQQQQPQQQQQQQPLPVPLFSNNDNNYPPQSYYPYDDRMAPQRYERRKPPSHHPYHRNEQDYQNSRPRNGNYNQQRRGGGGGGGGYNNNYYR